jgi:hypothetical protein
MDAWDWMYAGVYEEVRRRADTALQQQLQTSYLYPHGGRLRLLRKAVSRDARLRAEANTTFAWQLAGSGPRRRTAGLDLLQKRGDKFIAGKRP